VHRSSCAVHSQSCANHSTAPSAAGLSTPPVVQCKVVTDSTDSTPAQRCCLKPVAPIQAHCTMIVRKSGNRRAGALHSCHGHNSQPLQDCPTFDTCY
jgi:hypothetical protein